MILIQVDEAHSDDAWPMALDGHPKSQKSFKNRVDRATYFVEKHKPPYPVYIDNWSNEFANKFRAWPDKYHCVDSTLTVTAKSEYGDGKNEALIIKDYTELINELIKIT